MLIYKKIITTSCIALALFVTGCAQKQKTNRYPDVYHGKLDKNSYGYKKGLREGCKTAKGTYTKNHTKFRSNVNYHEGWFEGRRKCQIAIW